MATNKGAAPIHVFRAGRQITAAGEAIDFSEADLAAMARAYDPTLHEAPICVGHPRDNLPAYGWLSRFTASKGNLYAEPREVDPEFAELVRAGRFKKVSLALYAPDSPRNPKPGVYYPRHLAMLGAEPPAVKGLKPVEFADAADERLVFAEVAFSDPLFGYVTALLRGVRDLFIEKFGLETADAALPTWRIESIDEMARDRDPPAPALNHSPAFSEGTRNPPSLETGMTHQEIEKLQADLAAANKAAQDAQSALQANQAAAAAAEKKARHEGHVAFAESLVQNEQLTPADKPLVVAALDAAVGDTDKDIQFGEGDDKKPLATALHAFFSRLPKDGLNGKHLASKGAQGSANVDDPLEFGEGTRVDDASLQRHRQALALSKERGIPYIEAAREIAAGH